jgi:uncharacterized protein
MMTADGAVQLRPRLLALDVLRGVAVLGILLMNIGSFAMPDIAYVNPRAWGEMGGLNGLVQQLTQVFASGKFISIFALLFGAGIALQTRHGLRLATHLRRMAALFVIGLAHAYLLWHGDILVTYALLGVCVFGLRRMRPRALVGFAATLYALGLLLNSVEAVGVMLEPPGVRDSIRQQFAPPPEGLQREIAVFRGTWLEQMPLRATRAFESETTVLVIYSVPYVGGLMLLGMAVVKAGVLERELAGRRWVGIAVAGCGVGWTIELIALGLDRLTARDPLFTVLVWSLLNRLAMPPTAIGYAAIVFGAVASAKARRWLWPLAAVGRTALTCYLLETVLCTTLFYGHGLGWFGRVERVQQLGVVIVIWIGLLVIAPLWLRAFKQGPMEWLWRAAYR